MINNLIITVMKQFVLLFSFVLMLGFVNTQRLEAQVHVNINIDIQPAWGPSGYHYVEYYYIPEINVYYDVIHRRYYYPKRGRWISCTYLPMAYCYYDFYSMYKVVLTGILKPW